MSDFNEVLEKKGFFVAVVLPEFNRFLYWFCVSAVFLGLVLFVVFRSFVLDWSAFGFLMSAAFSFYFLEVFFDWIS